MSTHQDTSLHGMISRLMAEENANKAAAKRAAEEAQKAAKATAAAKPEAVGSLADLVEKIQTEREAHWKLASLASPEAMIKSTKEVKKPKKPFLTKGQWAAWIFFTLVVFTGMVRFDQALQASVCDNGRGPADSCQESPNK